MADVLEGQGGRSTERPASHSPSSKYLYLWGFRPAKAFFAFRAIQLRHLPFFKYQLRHVDATKYKLFSTREKVKFIYLLFFYKKKKSCS